MTDRDYIDEIKKGNKKMLNDLYGKYRGRFFNYFLRHFNISQDEVADVYQDSWTAMWTNIRDGKLTSRDFNVKLETYLFQVGRNICLARNRKTKRVKKIGIDILNWRAIDVEDIDMDNNHAAIVQRDELALSAVRVIGEPCSSLLVKFYIERKKGEQIALELNYKDATSVKAQKYKCMQKLKSMVEAQLQKNNLQ